MQADSPTASPNNRFVNNLAQGGDWRGDDHVHAHHLTLAGNQAIAGAGTVDGTAGGGGFYLTSGNGSYWLSSSILADNTATPAGGSVTANDCGWDGSWDDSSAGYNLIEAPGTCVFTYAPTDVTGVDPVLAGLVGSDCTTTLPDGTCIQTMALASTSPAIDAGSCTTSTATTDQRGYARPFDEPDATNVDDGCDDGDFLGISCWIFGDCFETGDTTAWSATVGGS